MDSQNAEEEQNEKKAPPKKSLAVPIIRVVEAIIRFGPEWIEKLELLNIF